MADAWVGWRRAPLPVRAAQGAARVLRPLLLLARIEPRSFELILAARVGLEHQGAGKSGRACGARPGSPPSAFSRG